MPSENDKLRALMLEYFETMEEKKRLIDAKYPNDVPNEVCNHALIYGMSVENSFSPKVGEFNHLFSTKYEDIYVWTYKKNTNSALVSVVNPIVKTVPFWKTAGRLIQLAFLYVEAFETPMKPVDYKWMYYFDFDNTDIDTVVFYGLTEIESHCLSNGRIHKVMVGKGSVNHNSRKFNAKNTDPERTHNNISFCNENIRAVYHELFDEAQKRFNEKQARPDRRIDDYYEKIRNGIQEKPFHELILQIGNCNDTAIGTVAADKATEALKEYYQGFQKRNPYLRVFSAHLHLDEHTPHIHIDFVPFTTGSKRGLDTRVSLKQALLAQGFKGDGKHNNEWNRWVQSEKEILATVMERYGFEWEQKGTHEEHLSDYDYKKKMRAAEVAELTEKVAEKQSKFSEMSNRVQSYDNGASRLADLKNELDTSPDYALPEPQGLISAKSYKAKFAEPLMKKLKKLVLTILAKYFEVLDDYHRLNNSNGRYYSENEALREENRYLTLENAQLKAKNRQLRAENKDFAILKMVFGKEKIENFISEAKDIYKSKHTEFKIVK